MTGSGAWPACPPCTAPTWREPSGITSTAWSEYGELCLPAPPPPARSSSSWIEFVWVHRYDDYDYGEVNQLLPRDLKLYIKAVACFPDASKTPVCPLTASERVGSPALLRLQPFFPALGLIYISPSPRYTWICWSWRPGCRASCCMPWEPSPSTWSPKCWGRADSTCPSGTERRRTRRAAHAEACWRRLEGHRAPLHHSSASWMFFFCSVLMHLHHGRPSLPPGPPCRLSKIMCNYSLVITGLVLVCCSSVCENLLVFSSVALAIYTPLLVWPASSCISFASHSQKRTLLYKFKWMSLGDVLGFFSFFEDNPRQCWIAKDAVFALFVPTLVKNNSDTAGSDGIAIVSFNKHFLRKKKTLYIYNCR